MGHVQEKLDPPTLETNFSETEMRRWVRLETRDHLPVKHACLSYRQGI